MSRIWILFGLAIAVCAVAAQSNEDSFPDYWQNDYESQWYDDEIEKLGILEDSVKQPEPNDEKINDQLAKVFDASEANADEKVQDEIQQFLEEPNKVLNDYQIEDNRSKLEDYDEFENQNNKETDLKQSEIDRDDETFDEIQPIPEVEESNGVSEEKLMQEIGIDLADRPLDDLRQEPKQNDINDFSNVNDISESNADDDMFENEEVQSIAEESADPNEDNIVYDNIDENKIENLLINNQEEADTNQEGQAFKEQPDAINKLSGEIEDQLNEPNDIISSDEVSHEDIAKELDNVLENILINDPDLAELFESSENIMEETKRLLNEDTSKLFEESQQVEGKANENTENGNDKEIVEEKDSLTDILNDLTIHGSFEAIDNENEELPQEENLDLFDEITNVSDSAQEDEETIDYETVDKVYSQMKEDFNKLFDTIDKLVDSESEDSNSIDVEENFNISAVEAVENRPFNEENILRLREEQYDDTGSEEINEDIARENDTNDIKKDPKTLLESEITSVELNDLMVQFAIDHADDLDIQSNDFDKNVAAVTITLNTDDATVVTSPNYPSPYPTNNIIDWVFEGQGMGIEFNLTDFSVNGFLGDYLLVKPGGVDETGHDGLIFSYNLNSARRYRFLDVNRMFVRFEARPGMAFTRGFSFSVKMITPAKEEPEDIPATEALVDPPVETLLVYVAGVVQSQFVNISEEFRVIVADMATLYLNRAGDNIGEKTTVEVTQITQTAVCNTNWPGFERCTAVRFGIPLALTDDDDYRMSEDDLRDMWDSMVTEDPFLARMRRLGITEFAVPNDESTLLVWVVISVGVIISAAMLGLALWRWSCFEDYTRMAPYSDTDSVFSEKKKPLELFPAPHQNLPALYDDDFVKYDYDTTRVDMGGFTNQSYSRDADLFDIESDDDVRALPTTKRDSSNIRARGEYEV